MLWGTGLFEEETLKESLWIWTLLPVAFNTSKNELRSSGFTFKISISPLVMLAAIANEPASILSGTTE